MCGGKRRPVLSAGPRGYHSHSSAHKRGCGRECWSLQRDDQRQGGVVSNFANSPTIQTTGIVSNDSKYYDLPIYTSSNNLSSGKEKRSDPVIIQSDQPPAYTPQDPAPTNIASHGSEHVPMQARQLSQHTGFAAFSIPQSPARAGSGDLFTLEDRLAALKLGMRESKCAARRAKNQLVHDDRAAEEMERDGRCGMSRGERKLLKAQMKTQMKAVKVAIRDEMRGNRKY